MSNCNICIRSLQNICPSRCMGVSFYIASFQCNFPHIYCGCSFDLFRHANLCKWADPYPAKNKSEAAPNNNMAAQWIPKVDVFFESLVRVIHGARSHLSTNQIDSAELWCRRLDEYERTLTLSMSRVEESRSDQETFLQHLQMLTAFVTPWWGLIQLLRPYEIPGVL